MSERRKNPAYVSALVIRIMISVKSKQPIYFIIMIGNSFKRWLFLIPLPVAA